MAGAGPLAPATVACPQRGAVFRDQSCGGIANRFRGGWLLPLEKLANGSLSGSESPRDARLQSHGLFLKRDGQCQTTLT